MLLGINSMGYCIHINHVLSAMKCHLKIRFNSNLHALNDMLAYTNFLYFNSGCFVNIYHYRNSV